MSNAGPHVAQPPADSLLILNHPKTSGIFKSIPTLTEMSTIIKSPTIYAEQLDPINKASWATRLRNVPAWDEENDPISLSGPPAIPMPVQISSKDSLAPVFQYLKDDPGLPVPGVTPELDFKLKKEPYYNADMIEFRKGAAFEDGRLDMCKMVVGPDHIGDLMSSLEDNRTIKHFLLGNNVTGRRGATRINKFLHDRPEQIETWYLGANCFDATSFKILVDGLVQSPSVLTVWVKRNPLTSKAAADVVRLILNCKSLRTLDLDQTELGDVGVAHVFNELTKHLSEGNRISLRNIYLNGVGISVAACKAIQSYLAHENCEIEALFMSNNPIGDAGLQALAKDFHLNKSLWLLSLQSCGLKDNGINFLLKEVMQHPKLATLNLGQSYSTPDLGTRFNHITDAVVPSVVDLICASKLRVLSLKQCYISHEAIVDTIGEAVFKSQLLYFEGNSVLATPQRWKERKRQYKADLKAALERNIQAYYGDGQSLEEFEIGALRTWRNCADVRLIDSVYRNRDAGLARRGQLIADKWWNADDWTEFKSRID